MYRLFKAELYKLRKNRSFMILGIAAVLIGCFTINAPHLSVIQIKSLSPTEQQIVQEKQHSTTIVPSGTLKIPLASEDMFSPTGKELFHASFGIGFVELLLIILIGAFVANEYSQGTIKNMLSYGEKRIHYYLAKFFALSIGLGILLGIMILIPLISGFITHSSWGSTFNLSQVEHIIFTFFAAWFIGLGIIAIMMVIATLLKNNGSTIGVGIGLFMVGPSLLGFLYGKYTWFDTLYNITPSYNWALATFIHSTSSDVVKAALTGIITTVIALGIGIMILKKQDIK